ncbi:TPA: hypothetical protein DCP77_01200 [Candidatus Collierbacteria bacterium]|uniref:DUF4325 domain-containing protein n=1 Tax=Candidatus Collierbacteria bacterium GW2011_GWA2_42_17 TaxID=1618378 RepID=A0A0G1C078_9BACT|nr:MAG: hypothetical protein UU94_C0003G0008 [Candidatus Collierbacteria bacterium GW2011_GWB2_42_12]KKS43053.1 MAG: hypothetical protein UV06_C0003G0054 [Candidatus Collierbacteria bacterium GW2011_GWA2_42_17]KKS62937.1 MAG: hypothetical protein UV28_C0003G0035 [Candidatus Collierbacteria bacterium GW2011_GWE2_42_48]KKS63483.1 MAG: hypothetical protein UV29_C0001G0040 [Candidatus Collierbacteria bacterium GW2011_GWD2_42_50]KKS64560.1 MAG: hypothetical protein UV32_C0012G0044 [Candidatus Collie
MTEIILLPKTGNFAENKDIARNIRLNELIPMLENGEDIILNFKGVEAATQSFIHALISDLFRKYGNSILDRISFKDCNEKIRKIISIVTDYMQE